MSNEEEKEKEKGTRSVAVLPSGPVVIRSPVPVGLAYSEYREHLRYDFYYACAYCTMSECEAQGIRFTIDHYEPRSLRPELENDYDNLMYACDVCNRNKGDLCPPEQARADGYRFLRVDQDTREEHLQVSDRRLSPLTRTGEFTIDNLDLNRRMLQELRELRRRLTECDRYVGEGVLGLREFPLDRLPPNIRGKVAALIKRLLSEAEKIPESIDELLRRHSRSHMLDSDPDAVARAEIRAKKQKRIEALYPASWRAPRHSKSRATTPRKRRKKS